MLLANYVSCKSFTGRGSVTVCAFTRGGFKALSGASYCPYKGGFWLTYIGNPKAFFAGKEGVR